jgi:endoglucanase
MTLRLLALAALAGLTIDAAQAGTLFGVNLSGMEQGSGNLAGTNYAVPDPTYLDGQNVQVIRLPFLLERLQNAGQPLNSDVLGYITGILQKNAAANVVTVLDPHDYGYIGTDGTSREIGVDPVGTAEYVDAVTKLAAAVVGMPNVAFGLMNEPHDQSCAELAPVWQRAITAIRGTGFTGPIMVPPTNWSHADTLVSSGCAALFGALQDPEHGIVVEVHNYLDPNQSGEYQDPIAALDVGWRQLAPAIAWSEQTGIKLFVGETGSPPDGFSVAALSNELRTISAAGGSFWGVTLWSAGPWWPASYVMDLNPVNGVIAPQMVALSKYTTTPQALVLALGEDSYQGNANYFVMIDGHPTTPIRAEPIEQSSGNVDPVTISGPFRPGQHTATVTFVNDDYAGSPSTDRNLYLDGATFDGQVVASGVTPMYATGSTASFSFTFNAP